MDIILAIILIVLALVVGLIIGYLMVKSNLSAKVGSLQSQLDQEKQLHLISKEALQKSDAEKNTYEASKTEAEKKTAVAETSLSKEQETLAKLREEKSNDFTRLSGELDQLRRLNSEIKAENEGLKAQYAETVKRLEEQQTFLKEAQQSLKDAFGSLSAEALKSNNTSFVELAKAKLDEKVTETKGEFAKKEQAIGELVKPLSESLKTMDAKIQDLEAKRIRAYGDIWNYLDQVKATTEGLKKETTNLVGALKNSSARGRYGEIALRRLVEHAGMFEHCDFEEQVSVEDESGKLRPDMIIKLPGNKTLVVDSKAPLNAYLKIFETDNPDEQKVFLGQHVNAVKDHLKKLSAKAYWSQFEDAPDFVIMYIHIESSYGAALQAWPEMIEEAMKNRIIIATPTVLLSILMGVGYSWNQLKTMENIEAIRDAAVLLHDRSAVMIEHLVSMGKSLGVSVNHYNKAIGSMEASFLPQARKIKALSEAYVKNTIPELTPVETTVREVTAQIPKVEEPAIQALPFEEIRNKEAE
jgi:DNA recombination protein RmuC